MKTFAILSCLAVSALAQDSVQIDLSTIGNSQSTGVQKRGITSSELENGPCKQITFVYARGSTEPGNMGIAPGPQTCSALKTQYGSGNVACQGVDGGKYSGDLFANLLPKGTTQDAINEGARLLNLASTKCPNTKIVAGGYSQGAALMAGSISGLSSKVMNQINSVVLYGYTKNKQNGARIPNYPTEKTKIICEPGDLVCDGTLIVTPAHLLYLDDVNTAKNFYVDRINNH